MKLSVIVPVYNMAEGKKLEYCMESLIHQSIQDYEIIAVDDASTDNSLEILKSYEAKYPEKVKVLHYEQNKRQGGAKNEGLKLAKGEWIGFIDSDDWITADYYERLLQKAEETGADLVGCDYNLVTEHTMQVGKVVQSNSMEQTGLLDLEKHKSLLMRPGSMVIKLYKHQVIQEHQLSFPEGIFYEDNCAGPLWSLYFTHYERVEEPMYYYYQHQLSTVHHVSEGKCRDRMKAAELFYEECERRGFLDGYKQEIEYRFTELYYINTLFSYMQGVKHPKLSFVKELRDGVLRYAPTFEKNPYYLEYTDQLEQKLIHMHLRSNWKFCCYYQWKQLIWRLRR